MKPSLLMIGAMPLLVLTACPSDSGSDDVGDDADDGISTAGDTADDDETGSGTTTGDGDTVDDDTETADTTDTTTGMNCGEVSIVPEYTPPNVMLVVDASGSMVSNDWDHDQDIGTPEVTRWNTLYGVVDIVMTNFGPSINAGLQRFPSADACPNAVPGSSNCYNAGACVTGDVPEVDVALDNAAAIIASIPGPNAGLDPMMVSEIIGGTPATSGIVSARAHLLDQPVGIPNYILLITDGAANCGIGQVMPALLENYDEELQTTVGDAFVTDTITTFVVGIDILDALTGSGADGSPTANAFEELNEVAVAGGAPKNMGMDAEKFYNTQNQQELLDAIELILDEVTDCTIDLNEVEGGLPTPDQIPYVEFEIDGMLVPYVEDCATEDGWTWIVEGEIMSFCGSYCEDLQSGLEADGTYGCPPAG